MVAALVFTLAVLHTFSTKVFARLAQQQAIFFLCLSLVPLLASFIAELAAMRMAQKTKCL